MQSAVVEAAPKVRRRTRPSRAREFVPLGILVPPAMRATLDAMAAEMDVPLSVLCRNLLRAAIGGRAADGTPLPRFRRPDVARTAAR